MLIIFFSIYQLRDCPIFSTDLPIQATFQFVWVGSFIEMACLDFQGGYIFLLSWMFRLRDGWVGQHKSVRIIARSLNGQKSIIVVSGKNWIQQVNLSADLHLTLLVNLQPSWYMTSKLVPLEIHSRQGLIYNNEIVYIE